jgi:hypothetical protein
MGPALTQPLTETNTRISFWGVKQDLRLSRQPHHHLRADCLENVRSSTSHNPIDLHSLLQGYLYFFTWFFQVVLIASNA